MRKTEEFAETYRDLETRESADVLRAILDAQGQAFASLEPALPSLAEAAAARLREHPEDRLVYAGARTSARLGVSGRG